MLDVWIRRKDASIASFEAAAVAGPVFAIVLVAVATSASVAPTGVHPSAIGGAIGFVLLSIPFGFALAIVPCFLATHLLLSIARQGDGSLNPLAWLLLGVSAAAALGYIIDGDDGGLVMGLTGGILAMFARHRALGRAGEDG